MIDLTAETIDAERAFERGTEPDSVQEWAIRYAHRGWAVLPFWGVLDDLSCECGRPHDGTGTPRLDEKNIGKHPVAGRSWSDAKTDLAVIEQWFPAGTRHNVTIVPGKSSLLVLDIDGPEGEETAKLFDLPRTLEERSGNGRHLYYACEDVDTIPSNNLGPDINTRARNMCVIATPSRHRNGSTYSWTNWPIPPAPLPDAIADRLRAGGTTDLDSTPIDAEPVDGLSDALARIVSELPGADRSRQLYDLVNRAIVDGHTDGQILTLARRHRPSTEKYGTRLEKEVRRCIGVARERNEPLESLCDRGEDDGDETNDGTETPTLDAEDVGWHRIDLAPALAGAIERTLPTVFTRDDKLSLFYTGRLNGLHGDSGTGKSMMLAVAAAQEMTGGGHVIWVDLEDPDPTTLIERLRVQLVDDKTIIDKLHYYAPREAFSDVGIAELVREAHRFKVTLMIVDSLGEAFGLNGVNEDKDAEVGPFLRRYMRPLADAGPAVVMVDHSTKANDNPLHPSGSKRKRAAIQGASYLVEARKSLTREHGGRLALICAKDRHGNYRRGSTVATLDMLVYPDGGVSVKVYVPEPGDRDTPEARLLLVARAVVRTTKEAGRPLSQRELLSLMAVKGSKETKCAGIDTAAQLGGIRIDSGKRNASLHTYVKDLDEGPRP